MSDTPSEDEPQRFMHDTYDDIRPMDMALNIAHPRQDYEDPERNFITIGDSVDLTKKDPTLRNIHVGAGWEQKSMEAARIDVDLSCFLLNKDGLTRVDEDFIFYNNESGCDGAVDHHGDSRTGAGEGDDEAIDARLNDIPYDVLRLVFVLTIYDEDFVGRTFDMVRDLYIRVVNSDDHHEIVRLPIPEDAVRGQNAVIAFELIREGPRWLLESPATPVTGGLAAVAKLYGIIIKEIHN